MASSRVMRKSPRNASPMTGASQAPAAPHLGTPSTRAKEDKGDEWVEPKLRVPAPSFEDHRGLERHGVLEQMAPLGTMPPQNKRLRAKEWQPSPTPAQEKLPARGDSAGATEALKESEQQDRARRSESRKFDDKSGRRGSTRVKGDDDADYAPKPVSRPTSSKSITITKTPLTEQQRLMRNNLATVVEASFTRSVEIGNEILGLAIRRVFQQSADNPHILILMDAVLNQGATNEGKLEFQNLIKLARKDIKAGISKESTPPPATITEPTPAVSLPPSPVKRTRRSTSRNIAASNNKDRHAPTTITPAKSKSRVNGTMSHANGNRDEVRPAKRAKRSGSVSSESSLSSTHSLPELEAEMSESNDLPTLKTRSNGTLKLHTFVGKNANGKRPSGAVTLEEDPVDVELAAKKSKLSRRFSDYHVNDSSVRGELTPVPATLPTLKITSFPKMQTPTTSRSNQEEYDDLASPASSFQGEFLVPPPPGALRVSRSRAATPTALGRPRKEEPKRLARLKMSPHKKKTGTPSTGRESSRLREREKDTTSVANDSDSGEGENNDFCTSCGGNGELLCCDGCPRSFHLACLDPPLSSAPEGEWLCFHCEAKREPHARPARGLLALLNDKVRWLNPKQFGLSEYVRNYFEGVKTGDGGEYGEVSQLKVKPRQLNHHGRDEVDERFKLKDAKGNFILCFRCGKSAAGHREIINCDYCTLRWHLDCLDPPLANAPVRDPHSTNRARNSWMCPAHSPSQVGRVGYGGRLIKIRRPRHARVIESVLPRGVKNAGVIEIENDPSDEETSYDLEDNIIYRVTERSIKLDFIDRIHKKREEATRREDMLREAARLRAQQEAESARNAHIAFNNRSFIDKQAALSLAQFATANAKPGLKPDEIQSLINALIADAPDASIALIAADESDQLNKNEAVVDDITRANPSSMVPTPPDSDTPDRTLTTKQKQSYLLLIDLIQKRLEEAENVE